MVLAKGCGVCRFGFHAPFTTITVTDPAIANDMAAIFGYFLPLNLFGSPPLHPQTWRLGLCSHHFQMSHHLFPVGNAALSLLEDVSSWLTWLSLQS
jgi:hypothetical protein